MGRSTADGLGPSPSPQAAMKLQCKPYMLCLWRIKWVSMMELLLRLLLHCFIAHAIAHANVRSLALETGP